MRKVIYRAQSENAKILEDMLEEGNEKGNVLKVARMVKDNKDVVGCSAVKDSHQGSILSPLLFTIVLEALSREFRCGLPWELLYADDLDLMAESEDKLMEKFELWRFGMEDKGFES